MNRTVALALFTFAAALAAVAQSSGTPAGDKTVAVVNGETITAKKLDGLYDGIGAQMRAQYEKAGGKQAFLDNYIRKRLLIREALKSGFDKRPDVREALDEARDAALFDQYVRGVVAASIVSNADVRAYYDQHPDEFKSPEKAHIRQILIAIRNEGPNPRSAEVALQMIGKVATELHALNATTRAPTPSSALQLRIDEFAQLARKYSEDSSAQSGGDLGWISRDQLDPAFGDAAFALPIGVPSGIVKSSVGYHIILVEGKQPAGKERYEEVRSSLREFLMTQRMSDIMAAVTKLTDELQAKSKIAVYPENIR